MEKFRLTYPDFSAFFPFQEFNSVQLHCLPIIINTDDNIIVSAPTSSGKTVIFQLAIIKCLYTMLSCQRNLKCVYLAPIKSLCHQKGNQWKQKFINSILSNKRNKSDNKIKFPSFFPKASQSFCKTQIKPLKVYQLTGDTNDSQQSQPFQEANIIIATPQKIDSFSRNHIQQLKKIDLLLIDQVHMLNLEQRGATLQAVVSRIISLKSKNNLSLRIVSVSATIKNINEVGEWLKVPKKSVCVFGQQFRPVKLKKVVLGFKTTHNPFTFEKILNYKLLQVIRTYSQQKGSLVFCQTQKGTQSACQQLINDMRQRQLIQDDTHLLALVQNSKMIMNKTLQIMLLQGIAFHNASLSLNDRQIVEKLFTQSKVKILCTTSTLAMGINLPARLVVIKSTKTYRGSARGYQEYTKIQLQQMSGRAGRVQYDTQGTVVIMTEKNMYNHYMNLIGNDKLQILESHFYMHLIEHINAEISLRTITNLKEAIQYFKNSFCYIRLKKSPELYGIFIDPKQPIQKTIDKFVQEICEKCVLELKNNNFVSYEPKSKESAISPRILSINAAKNSIEIKTLTQIIHIIKQIKTQRKYLQLLCGAEELKKIRSKLDQRKFLKSYNETNKYALKDSISTPQRKCFVLAQRELSGKPIQNWEMKKQAKQNLYFFRRLNYCLSQYCLEYKYFWPYFWAQKYLTYLNYGFWQLNEQQVAKQIYGIQDRWKMLNAKGINSIQKIQSNLDKLSSICQRNIEYSNRVQMELEILKGIVLLKLQQQIGNFKADSAIKLIIKLNYSKQSVKEYCSKLKKVIVCLGKEIKQQETTLYCIKNINFNDEGQNIYKIIIPKQQYGKYYISIIKQGYVGFDEHFFIETSSKSINNVTICQFCPDHTEKKQKPHHENKKNKTLDKIKPANVQKKSNSIDNLVRKSSIMKKQIKNKEFQQENEWNLSSQSLNQSQYGISKQKILHQRKSIDSLDKNKHGNSDINRKLTEKIRLPANFKSRSPFPIQQTFPQQTLRKTLKVINQTKNIYDTQQTYGNKKKIKPEKKMERKNSEQSSNNIDREQQQASRNCYHIQDYQWKKGIPDFEPYQVSHKRYLKTIQSNSNRESSILSSQEDNWKQTKEVTKKQARNPFSYFYNLF